METAVLMMAYGGPNSLADVPDYLLDVRGGRPTSPELLAEISQHYAQIGGRSPLLDITRAQAAALEARLNGVEPAAWRVYVGMRHWYPYIGEAVMQIVRDGIRRVVGLCMAPHYSRASIGAYFGKLEQAVQGTGVPLDVIKIEAWHDNPLFLQALAQQTRAAQMRFAPGERAQLSYLFTAHSLPVALKEQGDPYDAQVHGTAARLAAELNLAPEQWQFCYQSAGASGAQWMGPAIEDVIARLAREGREAILVTPIGFVADHVEVLYDIDIRCQALAQEFGLHLERSESLNTSPAFVDALAQIVRSAAR